MEDSVTYQAITRKGERRMLIHMGTKRFGAPSAEVLASLNAITDNARLDELGVRLLEVGSWEELLGTSVSGAGA